MAYGEADGFGRDMALADEDSPEKMKERSGSPGSPEECARAPLPAERREGNVLRQRCGATAVVSGGASGIGRQVAIRLLQEWPEARCVILDVEPAGAIDLVREFGGHRLLTIQCDVANPTAVREAVDIACEWGDDLRYLVNCAGMTMSSPSADLDFQDWRHVLGVHLDGTFLLCKHVGASMIAKGDGRIVNIGSVAMKFGWPRRLAYGAAKAAVGQVTRTLAVEWGPHGIRVNAIAPGYIETPLLEEVIEHQRLDTEAVRGVHALRRFGTADEVARAVLFLLSDASSFITGETLFVDGGFSVMKLP